MAIRRIDFHKRKYGEELLIDVGRIEALEGFIRTDEPHWLSFYDIMLLTGGSGRFWLDTTPLTLGPGRVYFSTPGQVRRFEADDPEACTGVVLFFTTGFIGAFFNDPLFLHKLQFFHNSRQPPVLELDPPDATRLETRLGEMQREIQRMRGDSVHMLRAMLYESLVRMNRAYAAQHGTEPDTEANPVVHRFRQLIERRFRELHRVQDYAELLAVTPGHLNDLSKRHLGVTAGEAVRGRILVEAKRLVLHSGRTFAHIASRLGFDDASYFSRFFRRYTGYSPTEYRARGRSLEQPD